MTNVTLKITVSHNQVTEKISVMSENSTMVVSLDENKTKVWNEIEKFNPSIVYTWGQQIWNMFHPNVYGKVVNVDILN